VISTLLIISTCLGDEIVLQNNNSYSGELVKFIDSDRILFKALPSANLIVDITEIQSLTLSNNTVIIENGKLLVDDYRKTDDLYYGKVFMTGICCIGILFIGILVIGNITILGDFDVCFDPNCD
tara:strand:+ start:113 stop:484 length:372 start_codon:yes stop_codon:yes gene_type:complete